MVKARDTLERDVRPMNVWDRRCRGWAFLGYNMGEQPNPTGTEAKNKNKNKKDCVISIRVL